MAAPLCRAATTSCTPPTQKNGMRLNTLPPKMVLRLASASRDVFLTTAPWLWTTALGSAEVPDVNTASMSSAGATSCSTASSNASSTPSTTRSSGPSAVTS